MDSRLDLIIFALANHVDDETAYSCADTRPL